MNRPDLIINLVHGTWGRGVFPRRSTASRPYWFETGSPFSRSLAAALTEANLSHELAPFEWSGSNSIRARDQAARCLAKRLGEQRARSCGANVLTIAHSHGGNVALRACQILCEENLNRGGSKAQSEMSVATIATPFIRLFPQPRPISVFWDRLVWLVLTCIASYSLFVFLGGVRLPFTSVLALFPSRNVLYQHTPLIAIITVIVLFGWILSTSIRSLIKQKTDALISASFYHSVGGPLRLLVVRGVDDEASLILTAGSIGARLINLLITFIDKIVLRILLITSAIWIVLFMVVVSIVRYLMSQDTDLAMELILFLHVYYPPEEVVKPGFILLVFFSSFLAIPVWTILAGILMCVYGRELLITAGFCSVAADSAPDISGEANIVTLSLGDDRGSGLVHFLYEHSGCVPAIVGWLVREREQSRPRPVVAETNA